MDWWTALADDELRARLSSRLTDAGFVEWLVIQRDNEDVARLVGSVLDSD